MELWGKSILSKVASVLGSSICLDQDTLNGNRLDMARMCVNMDISSSFPDSVTLKSDKGKIISIRLENEWKPQHCRSCGKLGHIECRQLPQRYRIVKTRWTPVKHPHFNASVGPNNSTMTENAEKGNDPLPNRGSNVGCMSNGFSNDRAAVDFPPLPSSSQYDQARCDKWAQATINNPVTPVSKSMWNSGSYNPPQLGWLHANQGNESIQADLMTECSDEEGYKSTEELLTDYELEMPAPWISKRSQGTFNNIASVIPRNMENDFSVVSHKNSKKKSHFNKPTVVPTGNRFSLLLGEEDIDPGASSNMAHLNG